LSILSINGERKREVVPKKKRSSLRELILPYTVSFNRHRQIGNSKKSPTTTGDFIAHRVEEMWAIAWAMWADGRKEMCRPAAPGWGKRSETGSTFRLRRLRGTHGYPRGGRIWLAPVERGKRTSTKIHYRSVWVMHLEWEGGERK